MSLIAIDAAIFAAGYIYNRTKDEVFGDGARTVAKTTAANEIQIPLVEEGAAIPMYFGRVRIRRPILAACGSYGAFDSANWSILAVDPSITTLYGLDMLFVLGIPFKDGVNQICNVWGGDTKMHNSGATGVAPLLTDLTGAGDHEEPTYLTTPSSTAKGTRDGTGSVENLNLAAGSGLLEFLNGNSSQELTDSTGVTSKTFAADRLTTLGLGDVPPKQLGNYRGYASVFMFDGAPHGGASIGDPTGAPAGDPPTADIHLRWQIGPTPNPPAYSFEASSYPNASLDHRTVGVEANPADVAYSILRDTFAKLGLGADRVDYESFRAAAEMFRVEGHGYSCVFEGLLSAREMLQQICDQTDSAIDEDPLDGLTKIKPIRANYDPTTIRHITTANCERLENVVTGGWVGLVNKVTLKYEDRQRDYAETTVTAQNQANAVGHFGEVTEVVLNYPGVKTDALAKVIASRELDARSRPLERFTAICDRSFWPVMVGDPIKVSWPEYQVNGRVFRATHVNRGAADSNTITIDLVEDFFFVYRLGITDGGGLPSFPTSAV